METEDQSCDCSFSHLRSQVSSQPGQEPDLGRVPYPEAAERYCTNECCYFMPLKAGRSYKEIHETLLGFSVIICQPQMVEDYP